MNKFLKKAIESGRVKPLEDAFIDYPVEEEDHKGDAISYINDSNITYGKYTIGDIVYVNQYQYQDGKIGKDHLFVIVEENNMAVPIELFGMIISSRIEKRNYHSNKFLSKNNRNNLNKDSIVKTDYVYKIYLKNILFKIGIVEQEQIESYKRFQSL